VVLILLFPSLKIHVDPLRIVKLLWKHAIILMIYLISLLVLNILLPFAFIIFWLWLIGLSHQQAFITFGLLVLSIEVIIYDVDFVSHQIQICWRLLWNAYLQQQMLITFLALGTGGAILVACVKRIQRRLRNRIRICERWAIDACWNLMLRIIGQMDEFQFCLCSGFFILIL